MKLPKRIHLAIRDKGHSASTTITFREEEFDNLEEVLESVCDFLSEELLGDGSEDEDV